PVRFKISCLLRAENSRRLLVTSGGYFWSRLRAAWRRERLPSAPLFSRQLAGSASLEGKGQPRFTSGRWSPHHNCSQVATASDTTVRGWDTRSMSQVYCIENAHGQLVRDLDFNPNKQYCLASCGDDCKVKFWDTRSVDVVLAPDGPDPASRQAEPAVAAADLSAHLRPTGRAAAPSPGVQAAPRALAAPPGSREL
ncbi:PREDICTED: protein TSSC1, partial [Condylura cristata]|uniref:protein TSSC1 n=1 Tax=Condylura cristata TaxID=143302 RepID=UPI000642F10F